MDVVYGILVLIMYNIVYCMEESVSVYLEINIKNTLQLFAWYKSMLFK